MADEAFLERSATRTFSARLLPTIPPASPQARSAGVYSMKCFLAALCAALTIAGLTWETIGSEPSSQGGDEVCTVGTKIDVPSTDPQRQSAELLHETFEATLHAVHHHYYREDEALPIPGVAMKDVFRELADRRGVGVRWLAVNGQAMNTAHLPQNEFERNAVKALSEGQETYDETTDGVYQYVGMICLTNECLKCHVPNRKSTENRAAGIVITIPMKKP
ncbi:MAG: hypothetical protein C0483_24625 [Pirellula sp.]|nr:hypothetical protein [Pirellula sp.]